MAKSLMDRSHRHLPNDATWDADIPKAIIEDELYDEAVVARFLKMIEGGKVVVVWHNCGVSLMLPGGEERLIAGREL